MMTPACPSYAGYRFPAEIISHVARQSSPAMRIASLEMLPSVDLLPHVICSPPVFAGGGEHEADQHDDA